MTRSRSSLPLFDSSSAGRLDVPVLAELGPVRSTSADLPPPGPLRLGEVYLGAGRPVRATPAPAMWLTDEEVVGGAQRWRGLVDRFPDTGLWPLLTMPLEYAATQRPWDAGEFDPVPVADVEALDPAELLAGAWAGWLVPMGENPYVEHLRPFGAPFPGLAPPLPVRGEPASVPGDRLDRFGLSRLGLVRCDRPADAVAVIGWYGACNYRRTEEVAAVLRSWEDRFGVVLAGLGFARMTLLLPHPPASLEEALPIAAEVTALCRDVISLDGPTDAFGWRAGGTVEGLARCLVGEPVWTLWWD
ncbi:DUF4253 domain-containing protein [Trujillonella humicola]|uniref:DUF4253 domain-containing protein n=1 Tax=Trujillonella humicola TaxID=3383699 RepID=UPI003906B689